MPRGSSEIQFFMTREDEKTFVEFVLSDRSVGLAQQRRYETPDCHVFFDYDEFSRQPVMEPRNQTPIWVIWKRDSGRSRLAFVQAPICRRMLEPGYRGDPQAKRMFYEIDCKKNSVVILHRCVVKDRSMSLGGLAYQREYYDENNALVVRDESVTKWYYLLRNWVKKHSVGALFQGHTPSPITRVFPCALEWYRGGGKLEQLGMAYIPASVS
jgi:hypothetical protein